MSDRPFHDVKKVYEQSRITIQLKNKKIKMVFCYQNCFDLLCEKIVLLIEKNFGRPRICKNFEITRQFIQTVKGQNKFW